MNFKYWAPGIIPPPQKKNKATQSSFGKGAGRSPVCHHIIWFNVHMSKNRIRPTYPVKFILRVKSKILVAPKVL